MRAVEGEQVLRARDVVRVTGLSRQSLWRLYKAGEFPPPRQLSARSVGWLYSEIVQWLRDRQPSTIPRPGSSKANKEVES
jgi:prophage regulatory protein